MDKHELPTIRETTDTLLEKYNEKIFSHTTCLRIPRYAVGVDDYRHGIPRKRGTLTRPGHRRKVGCVV